MSTSDVSGFGELSTIQNVPVVQLDFVYGINANTTTTATANSGSVTTISGTCRLSTSSATNGDAKVCSRAFLKYHHGQGLTARFSAAFNYGYTNSRQLAGIGLPDETQGFFIGYKNAQFGIFQINTSETFIPMYNFNGAFNMNDIDTSKLNIYSITFQGGSGDVYFNVVNPLTGLFQNFHIIRYAGTVTSLNTNNPTYYLYWRIRNTGDNIDKYIYCGGGALMNQGPYVFTSSQYGFYSAPAASVTGDRIIFSLRCCSTLNGRAFYGQVKFKSLIIGIQCSSTVIHGIKIYENATPGTNAFTPISGSTSDNGVTITSGSSCVSYNTTSTTYTAGKLVFCSVSSASGVHQIDMTKENLLFLPGFTYSFVALTGASAMVAIAMNWSEDF